MVFVLVQIVVILNDVALELFLGHFLIEQELNVLLLEHPPLELHGAVAAHALDHYSVGVRYSGYGEPLLP